MTSGELPGELKQFIAQHIESLAQLEILLYLREHRNREVHPGEIANRLALTSEMTPVILADLARRGFAIKGEAGFRFEPASAEASQLIDVLAHAYRDRRVTVTTEIYSKSLDTMKTFAEAFRIRKEK